MLTLSEDRAAPWGRCSAGNPLEVIAPKDTPTATVRVLAVCHSLLLIDDG